MMGRTFLCKYRKQTSEGGRDVIEWGNGIDHGSEVGRGCSCFRKTDLIWFVEMDVCSFWTKILFVYFVLRMNMTSKCGSERDSTRGSREIRGTRSGFGESDISAGKSFRRWGYRVSRF
jgi:hypothetical protein